MARRLFVRPLVADLSRAVRTERRFLHVLVGARQTGKTTASDQVADAWKGSVVRASADLRVPVGPEWIDIQWDRARRESKKRGARPVLLVLDEVQKVRGWSEAVKAAWDDDRRNRVDVRPLLLGSSALLVQRGLTESLAGRFLLHRCPHWSFAECESAFRWSLERYLFFGGYPGAAPLARNEETWKRYIADSLIETAIARDVLAMQTVAKPALLRQLFGLAAQHPAEILSFTKMMGTLQDAGNTVTLASYLRLLESAFLVSGLERMTGRIRQRGSSPKLVFWNDALVSALSGLTFSEGREDPSWWGRLVENAVGAHLLNSLPGPRHSIGYWREGDDEVDFVVATGQKRVGIEVKSGRSGKAPGLAAFRKRFPSAKVVLVGRGGVPLDEALRTDPGGWLGL